jgi:hypothetical protein
LNGNESADFYRLFISLLCYQCLRFDLILVFNATFSNISAISWRPVLVVEEAGVPEENHEIFHNITDT